MIIFECPDSVLNYIALMVAGGLTFLVLVFAFIVCLKICKLKRKEIEKSSLEIKGNKLYVNGKDTGVVIEVK